MIGLSFQYESCTYMVFYSLYSNDLMYLVYANFMGWVLIINITIIYIYNINSNFYNVLPLYNQV